jgi:hypothetical protein
MTPIKGLLQSYLGRVCHAREEFQVTPHRTTPAHLIEKTKIGNEQLSV